MIEPSFPLPPPPIPVKPRQGKLPRRRRRRRDYTLLLLLVLTLIGGALRFTSLNLPKIWGDEAATYGRTAGTYRQMLDQLVNASFPPLHYELEWWIGQGLPYWGTVTTEQITLADGTTREARIFTPTHRLVDGGIRLSPTAMRMVPAIAGTLFIPAMYFLARQLFGRRVSLLTATLACFSAYLLNYSRDAKMYMEFWLALVLHVGCLLWWLRVRRPTPWALWVLSGVIMVGLHATGFIILALDVLILFTSPRQYWSQWFRIGALIGWLIALPFAYALQRRGRSTNDETPERWKNFLVYPRLSWRRFHFPSSILFALGLVPIFLTSFGPLGFYSAFNENYQRVAEQDRAFFRSADFGLSWIPDHNAGRSAGEYFLFTAAAYLEAWEWPRDMPHLGRMNERLYVAPLTFYSLRAACVALLSLLAIGLIPWRKIFRPRLARIERFTQDAPVGKPLLRRRGLWIAIWLTAIPFVVYTQSVNDPAALPDAVTWAFLKSPPSIDWPRMDVPPGGESYLNYYLHGAGSEVLRNTSAVAWAKYCKGFERTNIRWPVVIPLAVLLFGLMIAAVARRRLLLGSSLRLVLVVFVTGILLLVISIVPRFVNNDIWVPRYVALVLPAFLILAAVLIRRQPTWWLRAATIGLFVIVNLAQHAARVYADSEPPSDLIAADVVRSQTSAKVPAQPAVADFRAYIELTPQFVSPEPGGGTLHTPPGRYYLREFSKLDKPPEEVRRGAFEHWFDLWPMIAKSEADTIPKDLAASPQIKRFVIWSGLDAFAVDQTDPVAAKLKGQFHRVSDQLWAVRDHWRWYNRWQLRRREYVKIGD